MSTFKTTCDVLLCLVLYFVCMFCFVFLLCTVCTLHCMLMYFKVNLQKGLLMKISHRPKLTGTVCQIVPFLFNILHKCWWHTVIDTAHFGLAPPAMTPEWDGLMQVGPFRLWELDPSLPVSGWDQNRDVYSWFYSVLFTVFASCRTVLCHH